MQSCVKRALLSSCFIGFFGSNFLGSNAVWGMYEDTLFGAPPPMAEPPVREPIQRPGIGECLLAGGFGAGASAVLGAGIHYITSKFLVSSFEDKPMLHAVVDAAVGGIGMLLYKFFVETSRVKQTEPRAALEPLESRERQAQRLSDYDALINGLVTDDLDGTTHLRTLQDLVSKDLTAVTHIAVDNILLLYCTSVRDLLRSRLASCTGLTHLDLPIVAMEDVIPLLKVHTTDPKIAQNNNVTVTSGELTWLVTKDGEDDVSTIALAPVAAPEPIAEAPRRVDDENQE
jgi:hypothetical protein